MKAIIGDSIDHYASIYAAANSDDCDTLIRVFLTPTSNSDAFKPTLAAAELIFDEIEYVGELEKQLPDCSKELETNIRKILPSIKNYDFRNQGLPWNDTALFESQGLSVDEIVAATSTLELLVPAALRDDEFLEEGTLFLSPDTFLNKIAASKMPPKSEEEAILRLASSGVQFVLPSIGAVNIDSVREFRQKNEDLRQQYLHHWRNIARIASISEPDAEALEDLLKSELRTELKALAAACEEIERAVESVETGWFDRVWKLPVEEGLPGIFGAAFDLFAKGSAKSLIEELVGEAIRLYTAWGEPEGRVSRLRKENASAMYLYEMRQLAK